jgi:hypothetical protein
MASIIFSDILGNTKEVTLEDCIPLELKLNLTRYGRKYRELGDYLYKYKTHYGYSSQLPSTKIISCEELAYIDELLKLDYDDLKKHHCNHWTPDYYYE